MLQIHLKCGMRLTHLPSGVTATKTAQKVGIPVQLVTNKREIDLLCTNRHRYVQIFYEPHFSALFWIGWPLILGGIIAFHIGLELHDWVKIRGLRIQERNITLEMRSRQVTGQHGKSKTE